MSDQTNERNFFATLRITHPVNGPWLERQAIEIEEALIEKCSGSILGPSVTANLADNAFELDLTVKAKTQVEAYERVAEAIEIAEKHAGLVAAPEPPADEIHRAYDQSGPPQHDSLTLA
jgi:hypothetical protein